MEGGPAYVACKRVKHRKLSSRPEHLGKQGSGITMRSHVSGSPVRHAIAVVIIAVSSFGAAVTFAAAPSAATTSIAMHYEVSNSGGNPWG
jgi:hypothetical protein